LQSFSHKDFFFFVAQCNESYGADPGFLEQSENISQTSSFAISLIVNIFLGLLS